MINEATISILRTMRCSAMAVELERQITDPDTYGPLSFEERFGLLIDAEWNRRQNNKLAKCIKDAGFSDPNACMEAIEYIPDRKLDKARMTRLATCRYIEERQLPEIVPLKTLLLKNNHSRNTIQKALCMSARR